jgi:hypothetical protein
MEECRGIFVYVSVDQKQKTGKFLENIKKQIKYTIQNHTLKFSQVINYQSWVKTNVSHTFCTPSGLMWRQGQKSLYIYIYIHSRLSLHCLLPFGVNSNQRAGMDTAEQSAISALHWFAGA